MKSGLLPENKSPLQPSVDEMMTRIRTAIESSHTVLVVSHLDPDGDSLGTQLAVTSYLGRIGKLVISVRQSEIPEKYRFLTDTYAIQVCDAVDPAIRPDTVIVLECPSRDRIGRAAHYLDSAACVINIDHHAANDMYGTLNWLDATASSVGELMTEYFDFVGFELSPEESTQLYTAILTDTGRFRYGSTSTRTMKAAGLLISRGAKPQEITDAIYFSQPVSSLRLMGKVLNSIEFHHGNRICMIQINRAMLAESGAIGSEGEGLVDYVLHGKDAIVGALLKEVDGSTTKVSLRSRNGLDVAALAQQFGGGGHVNAAGCTIQLPFLQAREIVLNLLTTAMTEYERTHH
jgi:bifunctional oligoribonuclease and PAP phosphatase NrnA